jgi:hypothetical protein
LPLLCCRRLPQLLLLLLLRLLLLRLRLRLGPGGCCRSCTVARLLVGGTHLHVLARPVR